MKMRLGKKAFELPPIHFLLLFVALLVILIYIAYTSYTKGGGLLSNLFSSMRGGG